MRLNALQRLLERLYRIEVGHDVEDFLITDTDLATRLDNSAHARQLREKLLVYQDETGVHVSLYLDAEILAHLQKHDPLRALTPENLAEFLLALEGVSHFLYLVWNAACGRSVTLLELEMQAEVDKFLTVLSLARSQRRELPPAVLRHALFDAVNFDRRLEGGYAVRYREANHYAGQFCFRLETNYLRRKRTKDMMQEIRRFYRLSQTEKIGRIHTLSA